MTIEQDIEILRDNLTRLSELAISRYAGGYDQYGSYKDYPPEKFLKMIGTNLVSLSIAMQGHDVIEVADQAADCVNGAVLSLVSWIEEKK